MTARCPASRHSCLSCKLVPSLCWRACTHFRAPLIMCCPASSRAPCLPALQLDTFSVLQIVANLVDVYDNVLPCFPPGLDPVEVVAMTYSDCISAALDSLGQAAPSYDNAGALVKCICAARSDV